MWRTSVRNVEADNEDARGTDKGCCALVLVEFAHKHVHVQKASRINCCVNWNLLGLVLRLPIAI